VNCADCFRNLVSGFAGATLGRWREQQQSNRRPFLEKQLELGFQAAETAARLATETDSAQWEKAQAAFWRLYWGPLSIVEDRTVEGAMYDLGQLVPMPGAKALNLPMRALEGPSYKLAHAVRDLVLASWKVSLPALEGKPIELMGIQIQKTPKNERAPPCLRAVATHSRRPGRHGSRTKKSCNKPAT
jgi:hypothetical protein